ncbi:MAG TPA: hypothetical protein VMB46_06445 [Methanomassiliicoccales archaeon]|nr:hypothetical protein [Methanomassiliicoccales archaeon]
MKRVNEMIGLGLVKETQMEGAPFAKNVELTDKGREIARHVLAIEKLITESADVDGATA